jgi:Flp pilus assembly protein TadD
MRLVVLCLALATSVACASGGAAGSVAADQMQLGFKAARRGYWQEALSRFEQADAARPNQPRILNNLAVALEAVGRYDDALATYERAREIAPGDRNLRRNLMAFKEFHAAYVAKPEPAEDQDAGDEKSDTGEEAGND